MCNMLIIVFELPGLHLHSLKHSWAYSIPQAYCRSSCGHHWLLWHILTNNWNFQDVFETCLLQVFVMYYTNRFLMLLFLLHTNKGKTSNCTMAAISRHMKYVSKHTKCFQIFQTRQITGKPIIKEVRKHCWETFHFLALHINYECSSGISEYSCDNYLNSCLTKNIQILIWTIQPAAAQETLPYYTHQFGLLKLFSDLTQYENHSLKTNSSPWSVQSSEDGDLGTVTMAALVSRQVHAELSSVQAGLSCLGAFLPLWCVILGMQCSGNRWNTSVKDPPLHFSSAPRIHWICSKSTAVKYQLWRYWVQTWKLLMVWPVSRTQTHSGKAKGSAWKERLCSMQAANMPVSLHGFSFPHTHTQKSNYNQCPSQCSNLSPLPLPCQFWTNQTLIVFSQ